MIRKNNILCLDLGNTQGKVGVFQAERLIFEMNFSTKKNNAELQKILTPYLPADSILSSVRDDADSQAQFLIHLLNPLVLHHQVKLPFTMSPNIEIEKLGVDRIAALSGAIKMGKKNTNKLIISLGTCITYNYLNAENIFLGGAISPGLQMRLKAMHHFTGKLPLVSQITEIKDIENNTEKNLQSGALLGWLDEIDARIERFSMQKEPFEIFLTGGDLSQFVNTRKRSIFAAPQIILLGLHEIRQNNL